MYFALGLLVAGLLALAVMPAVWRRAVRLTKKRIEAATPITMAEFRAGSTRLTPVWYAGIVMPFYAAWVGSSLAGALLGAFGFSGDTVEKSCSILSGGEKARLVLAIMLFDPPNLLILDEPTNHLDIETKETLVKALSKFEGTLLFVSHDRSFLSALSNRVIELTENGPHIYGGGYDEYVIESGHEAPGLRD